MSTKTEWGNKTGLSIIRKLDASGDTIIEVMIAVVILALAFGIAYNVALNSTAKTENTQLANQATQILQDQVEWLRLTGLTQDKADFVDGSNNCFTPVNNPTGPGSGNSSCTSSQAPSYAVNITNYFSNGFYTYIVNVTWPTPGSSIQSSQNAYYIPPGP